MTERTSELPKRFQSWPPRTFGALLLLGSLATASLATGCSRKADTPEPPFEPLAPTEVPPPEPAAQAAADPPEAQEPRDQPEVIDEPPAPHPGPWFWIARSSVGIYREPRADRALKVGYAQRGGKLPVQAEKVEGKDCSKGWYPIVGGGYICSAAGTTNENDKIVKFAPRQPNLDEILPYPYARNAHHGTPLYRSLPSRAQMHEYEPYLPGAKKAAEKAEKKKAENGASGDQAPPTKAETKDAQDGSPQAAARAAKSSAEEGGVLAAVDVSSAASGLPESPPEEVEEPPKPWWQQENVKDRLHEIKLDELAEEADGILAKRMIRGFYVAVDNTFKWGGRNWYKTTKGLLAPVDRFWQVKGSEFKGVELDGETWKLPLGWVYGPRKQAVTYTIDEETKRITPKGSVKKFQVVQLTGKQIEIAKRTYHEAADGTWIRGDQIRRTTPGERPEGVGDEERWIDIDVSEQTLVAFQGDQPVYATLVSTGKESRVKAKDHRTPRGAWRVREKHVTGTMDGDGTAAGALPYSIEDVPYIMYYEGSYALHGAFWHENYGAQMSRGCVNLAPLDAKFLFFWADPQLPEGWYGVWSNDEQRGSLIVAHD